MKRKITIEFEMPDAKMADVIEYMFDAIQGWSGQFHPDDPLFAHKWNLVRIVRGKRTRK